MPQYNTDDQIVAIWGNITAIEERLHQLEQGTTEDDEQQNAYQSWSNCPQQCVPLDTYQQIKKDNDELRERVAQLEQKKENEKSSSYQHESVKYVSYEVYERLELQNKELRERVEELKHENEVNERLIQANREVSQKLREQLEESERKRKELRGYINNIDQQLEIRKEQEAVEEKRLENLRKLVKDQLNTIRSLSEQLAAKKQIDRGWPDHLTAPPPEVFVKLQEALIDIMSKHSLWGIDYDVLVEMLYSVARHHEPIYSYRAEDYAKGIITWELNSEEPRIFLTKDNRVFSHHQQESVENLEQ